MSEFEVSTILNSEVLDDSDEITRLTDEIITITTRLYTENLSVRQRSDLEALREAKRENIRLLSRNVVNNSASRVSSKKGQSFTQNDANQLTQINDTILDRVKKAVSESGDIMVKLRALDLQGLVEEIRQIPGVTADNIKLFDDTLKNMYGPLYTKLLELITSTNDVKFSGIFLKFYENIRNIAPELTELVNRRDRGLATTNRINQLLSDIQANVTTFERELKINWTDSWWFKNAVSKFTVDTFGFVMKVVFIVGILGGIGYGIADLIISTSLNGCYLYSKNGKSKIINCNIDIDNCKCGALISAGSGPKQMNTGICNSLDSSECSLPYCSGLCSGGNVNSRCLSSTGDILLQCTNTNLDDPNFIGYGYEQYTPESLIGNSVWGASNFLHDAGKALEKGLGLFEQFIQTLIKYGPILVGCAIFAFVIYSIFHHGTIIEENVKK